MTAYAELCVTSNFTFLRGASHPEELVKRATELDLTAITGRNLVTGVVLAFSALKELTRIAEKAGQDHAESGASLPRLIPGARLVLTDSKVEWVALPTDLAAWSRLTRLLSLGKRRAEKGSCHISLADLEEWGRGMVLIALPLDPLDATAAAKLIKDRDAMLTFYDYPAEHWKHIRTSNPIESVFATVRHRTKRTKGCLSRRTGLAMAFKLMMSAQKKWRKLDGQNRLPEIIQGVEFRDGLRHLQTAA